MNFSVLNNRPRKVHPPEPMYYLVKVKSPEEIEAKIIELKAKAEKRYNIDVKVAVVHPDMPNLQIDGLQVLRNRIIMPYYVWFPSEE